MSGFKEPGFADRQKAALEARKNILDKFRAKPGPDDPAVKQRQAEREAQAAARDKAQPPTFAPKTPQPPIDLSRFSDQAPPRKNSPSFQV